MVWHVAGAQVDARLPGTPRQNQGPSAPRRRKWLRPGCGTEDESPSASENAGRRSATHRSSLVDDRPEVDDVAHEGIRAQDRYSGVPVEKVGTIIADVPRHDGLEDRHGRV